MCLDNEPAKAKKHGGYSERCCAMVEGFSDSFSGGY